MNSKATMQPLRGSAMRVGKTVRGRWLVALAVLGLLSACTGDKAVEEPVQVEESAPPPQMEELQGTDAFPAGGTMSLDQRTVYFAFDDYSLSSDAQTNIDAVANYMRDNSSARVKLEGHCDERGSTEYNLALGQRRAQAVKDYLMQLGIDEKRLPTISYGEEKPAADGHDESAWSLNRRVEFVLHSE